MWFVVQCRNCSETKRETHFTDSSISGDSHMTCVCVPQAKQCQMSEDQHGKQQIGHASAQQAFETSSYTT